MKPVRPIVLFIVAMPPVEMPIWAEQDRGLADRFEQLDRDGDGKLTRQE